MATISTDDAASCETYCMTVGGIQQGSVAWTYYTDESNSCVCWESFKNQAGTEYSNDNVISGRFVDEGAPTESNCGNKCSVSGIYNVIDSGYSMEDCEATCREIGGYLGMKYEPLEERCTCANTLWYYYKWNADCFTVLF